MRESILSEWDKEEQAARLLDLRKGPWEANAKIARSFLKPPSEVRKWLAAPQPVSMSLLQTYEDRRRSRRIAVVLRPHWEDSDGITDADEIAIRDSLDDALVVSQLLELSIETGYIDESVALAEARCELLALGWSAGARNYFWNYDYIAVFCLAERLGIDIGYRISRPATRGEGADVRFAVFLDHLRGLYLDSDIDLWLGFLDDYVEVDDEHELFCRWLDSGKAPSSRSLRNRFPRLLQGAYKQLQTFADVFGTMREYEKASYGGFHAYWLAKLLGFERSSRGYRKTGTDWLSHLAGSGAFTGVKETNRANVGQWDDFSSNIAVIRATWHVVERALSELRHARI